MDWTWVTKNPLMNNVGIGIAWNVSVGRANTGWRVIATGWGCVCWEDFQFVRLQCEVVCSLRFTS